MRLEEHKQANDELENQDQEYEILQLLPAGDGYLASYRDKFETSGCGFEKVDLWCLVRWSDGSTQVCGMSCDPEPRIWELEDNFMHYERDEN